MSKLRELKEATKLRTNLLNQCVSKDETRPHLQGVCHVSELKALCSTDGYTACVLRSRYADSLADKIIIPKTFELLERDYVKIHQVIPIKFNRVIDYKIEKHHYFNHKASEKPIHAHFFDDGSISIGEYLETDKKRLFTLNAKFLKELVGKTYAFGFNKDLSPVAIALDGENLMNDIYIIMPLKV